jgi:hypothetical protein
LEYTEEHSRQRNSSHRKKLFKEHDMEWHGDLRQEKNSLINKILVSIRMRFIYTTLLQRVYSIEKIEPSVTVVLEEKR